MEEALHLIQIPKPTAKACAFPSSAGNGYIAHPTHALGVDPSWDVAYGLLNARHKLEVEKAFSSA